MGYKADKKKAASSFDPIPAGEYTLVITRAKKETDANGNKFLNMEYSVTKGKYKGRKIWERLYLEHPNEKAAEIAEQKLQQLMFATHITELPSKWKAAKLIGKPFIGRVAIEVDKTGKYGDKNRLNRPEALSKDKKKGKKKNKKHDDVPF